MDADRQKKQGKNLKIHVVKYEAQTRQFTPTLKNQGKRGKRA